MIFYTREHSRRTRSEKQHPVQQDRQACAASEPGHHPQLTNITFKITFKITFIFSITHKAYLGFAQRL